MSTRIINLDIIENKTKTPTRQVIKQEIMKKHSPIYVQVSSIMKLWEEGMSAPTFIEIHFSTENKHEEERIMNYTFEEVQNLLKIAQIVHKHNIHLEELEIAS